MSQIQGLHSIPIDKAAAAVPCQPPRGYIELEEKSVFQDSFITRGWTKNILQEVFVSR